MVKNRVLLICGSLWAMKVCTAERPDRHGGKAVERHPGGVAGGPDLPHRNLYVREKADPRRNFALDTLQRVKYVSKGVASGLET